MRVFAKPVDLGLDLPKHRLLLREADHLPAGGGPCVCEGRLGNPWIFQGLLRLSVQIGHLALMDIVEILQLLIDRRTGRVRSDTQYCDCVFESCELRTQSDLVGSESRHA